MERFRFINITLITLAGFVALALCAESCGKDVIPGSISERPIIPVVNSGLFTKAGGKQDLDALKSSGFKMQIIADADYNNGKAGQYGVTRTVTWNSPSWAIFPDAYWINDTPMSFWAYNTAAASTCDITTPAPAATNISFTYPKSDVTPDGQTDLLFAYATKSHDGEDGHSKGDEEDQIELEFKHALSQVKFTKGTFHSSLAGYEISKIEISGIKDHGTCTYGSTGFAWSALSGSATFDINSVRGSFIIIPQENIKNSFLQVTLSKTSSPDIVLSSPMYDEDKAMTAGLIYTYNINVSNQGKDLSLTLSVSDWKYYDRDLEIKEKNVTGYLNKDNYGGGVIDNSDPANPRIFIHNGMPVTGSFQLNSPKGAKLLLALDGNLDAFEVSPKICYIGDGPINFSITPKVDDPKIDYQTRLHIYLVGSDGSVSDLDQQVMKEDDAYKHYTIILPAQ